MIGKRNKTLFFILLATDAALVLISVLLIFNPSFGGLAVLNPKGIIALQERNLMVTATLLMFIVVIPVFLFTAFIVLKYKADGKTENHISDDNHKPLPAAVLWLIPASIIFILAGLVWTSTHRLDPHKKLVSNIKPLTVQVVALRWKWLFIYPEQNIATLNYLEIPEQTPIDFQLTADNAPMNSFWIPQLGGQMYAMTGMSNQLHLMANSTGEFQGSTAEMSGFGFAGMKFLTKSVSKQDFDSWVRSVKQGANRMDAEDELSLNEYSKLIEPSENNLPAAYSSVQDNLYNSIVIKYMAPATTSDGSMMQMEGMK